MPSKKKEKTKKNWSVVSGNSIVSTGTVTINGNLVMGGLAPLYQMTSGNIGSSIMRVGNLTIDGDVVLGDVFAEPRRRRRSRPPQVISDGGGHFAEVKGDVPWDCIWCESHSQLFTMYSIMCEIRGTPTFGVMQKRLIEIMTPALQVLIGQPYAISEFLYYDEQKAAKWQPITRIYSDDPMGNIVIAVKKGRMMHAEGAEAYLMKTELWKSVRRLWYRRHMICLLSSKNVSMRQHPLYERRVWPLIFRMASWTASL